LSSEERSWMDRRLCRKAACGPLVLVLVLVVTCSGADGNCGSAVDTAAVEGVGALAVAAAAVWWLVLC